MPFLKCSPTERNLLGAFFSIVYIITREIDTRCNFQSGIFCRLNEHPGVGKFAQILIEHTYALLFYAQCHQFLSSNKFKKTEIMTDESSAACNGTGNHNQDDTGRAQDPFYSNAAHYWGTVPANIEGMLGGFGHISSTDIGSSFKFLRSFIIVST